MKNFDKKMYVLYDNDGVVVSILQGTDPTLVKPIGFEKIKNKKLINNIQAGEYKKVDGKIVKMKEPKKNDLFIGIKKPK